MMTAREAAERIAATQGGNVDHIEKLIQAQLNKWQTDMTILTNKWIGLIGYSRRKARRCRQIVNALNRTKERL